MRKHNSGIDASSESEVISRDDKSSRLDGVCHLKLRISFHAKLRFGPGNTRSKSRATGSLEPAAATNLVTPIGCPGRKSQRKVQLQTSKPPPRRIESTPRRFQAPQVRRRRSMGSQT